MALKPLRFQTLSILVVLMRVVVATAELPDTPPMPKKVAPELSQWELSVAAVRGGPNNISPIKVFSDRRYEFGIMVHKGTLTDRDRAVVFTAATETFNRIHFAEGRIRPSDDVGMYQLRLSSGSRAICVELDSEWAEKMRFDVPLGRGLEILSRILNQHKRRGFYDPRNPFLPADRPQAKPLGDRRATVPEKSPDWATVRLDVISKDQSVKIEVHNPNHEFNRRLHKDMELTMNKGNQAAAKPRPFAISDGEREAVFDNVRLILNQFELHNPRDEEAEGDCRCVIALRGWFRDMEVEFKFNDALPQEWQRRISRILELGHRKDETFPTLRELIESDQTRASANGKPPGDGVKNGEQGEQPL